MLCTQQQAHSPLSVTPPYCRLSNVAVFAPHDKLCEMSELVIYEPMIIIAWCLYSVFFLQEIDPSTNELHTAYLCIFFHNPYPVKSKHHRTKPYFISHLAQYFTVTAHSAYLYPVNVIYRENVIFSSTSIILIANLCLLNNHVFSSTDFIVLWLLLLIVIILLLLSFFLDAKALKRVDFRREMKNSLCRVPLVNLSTQV